MGPEESKNSKCLKYHDGKNEPVCRRSSAVCECPLGFGRWKAGRGCVRPIVIDRGLDRGDRRQADCRSQSQSGIEDCSNRAGDSRRCGGEDRNTKRTRLEPGQWIKGKRNAYFELLYTAVQPIVPIVKARKLSFQCVSGESVNGSIAEGVIRRAPPTRMMHL